MPGWHSVFFIMELETKSISSYRNRLIVSGSIVLAAAAFLAGRITAPPEDEYQRKQPSENSLKNNSSQPAANRQYSSEKRRTAHGTAFETDNSTSGNNTIAKRINAILAQGNQLDRTHAWLDFVENLSEDEFTDVLTAFRENGVPRDRKSEYTMLLNAWAEQNPLAALEYAKVNTNSPFEKQVILATWAGSDPEAALAWAKDNYKGKGANPLLVGVIKGIAADAPSRATELMNSLPYSRERSQALSALLPVILQGGPQAARDWVEKLPDDRLRLGAMARVVENMARQDPEATLAWMLQSNQKVILDWKLDNVFGTWINKDQDAAIAAYQSLEGKNRSNAMRGIISTLAGKDPKAAADFLDAHPNDADDNVYTRFSWYTFSKNPAIAVNYVGRIKNNSRQVKMYNNMLDIWLSRDKTAALSWIEANQLPGAVLKHIDKRLTDK